MGTLQADGEEKQEMDDSGCIQDDSSPAKCQVQLLDLSDDVLLLILRHLDPHELKAVGYTCPRLGALVLDRSLWVVVDARRLPSGRARLGWLLAHALHSGTRELQLTGYAAEDTDCTDNEQPEKDEAKEKANLQNGTKEEGNGEPTAVSAGPSDPVSRVIQIPDMGTNARLYVNAEDENAIGLQGCHSFEASCPGPELTLGRGLVARLADTCRLLTTLAIEYCNINCHEISISVFPTSLTKLSMKGSKCYNLPLDRSFLFKVQDCLPDLETLDVSECDWMEPASLLPLSKLPKLTHLYMKDCYRMTEFVAYASLATRYGFTKLQCLDIRGSPFGDSEVSALGWLAALRRLQLSPARRPPPRPRPAQPDSPAEPRDPPDAWEREEPEYYKYKMSFDCNGKENSNNHNDSAESTVPSDLRTDAQKRRADTEAGPSKRIKPDDATASQADQPPPREPTHHVLYVNVGQRLHSVYRLSLLNQNQGVVVPRTVLLSHSNMHIDASSLVTDAAIKRFGRADGEDINYINIGPNGPYAGNTRPNRSSLTHLSITGFRHITDRSLIHLATAAPDLQFLDVSETNVTEQGVENFKSFRSDCEVVYSPYVERKDNLQL